MSFLIWGDFEKPEPVEGWYVLSNGARVSVLATVGASAMVGEGAMVGVFVGLPYWPVTAWVDIREGYGLMLRIGCQEHTVERWRGFSDALIAKMDSRALDWWRHFKDSVLLWADAHGAMEAARLSWKEQDNG